MDGVPGTRRGGYIVGAGNHRPKIVEPSIIRRSVANGSDATEAHVVIFAVELHLRIVDGLTRFINDFAADCRGGRKTQDEVFRFKRVASHNGGGKLFVLVVGGGEKSAPGSP